MELAVSLQLQSDLTSLLFRVSIVQNIVSGVCDFIAQYIMVRINRCTSGYNPFYSPKSSKIYRCWILWSKKIRVVIIPSFLAIAYLGQSIRVYHDLYLISRFNLSPSAIWIAGLGAITVDQGLLLYAPWYITSVLTALILSMVVNALVTGLIVFKILKVFLEIRPTSVERTLGSSTEDSKLQHIIFVIIESGMTLFAIQLGRVVLTTLMEVPIKTPGYIVAEYFLNFVIGIHEMLNVIIRSVHFYFLCFTDIYLARASHQQ